MMTYEEAQEEVAGFFSDSEEWREPWCTVADTAERKVLKELARQFQPHVEGLDDLEAETVEMEDKLFNYEEVKELCEAELDSEVSSELCAAEMDRTYDSLRRDW